MEWLDTFFKELMETLTYVETLLPALLSGAVTTVKLFVLTLLMSIPLGLPFALGSNSRFRVIRFLAKSYIWIFRGTPLMLQLFFFYFFLPIAFNIAWSSFTTAVITFVLNYAAYLAEIYRAGIESIDRGQHEAALSLGIGKARTMFGIILPQTIKRVLPPVSNEMITLIKDTALVSTIGVAELLKAAKGAVNRDVNAAAYAVAAIIYLLFTAGLTFLSRYLEKRFSRHEAKGN